MNWNISYQISFIFQVPEQSVKSCPSSQLKLHEENNIFHFYKYNSALIFTVFELRVI